MTINYQPLLKPNGEPAPALGYLTSFPTRSADLIKHLQDAKTPGAPGAKGDTGATGPAAPVATTTTPLSAEDAAGLALDTKQDDDKDGYFAAAIADLAKANPAGADPTTLVDGKLAGTLDPLTNKLPLNKNSSVKEYSENFITKASYSGIDGVSVSRIFGTAYALVTGTKTDYTQGLWQSRHVGQRIVNHVGPSLDSTTHITGDTNSKTTVDGDSRTTVNVNHELFNSTTATIQKALKYGIENYAFSEFRGHSSSAVIVGGPVSSLNVSGGGNYSLTAFGPFHFALNIGLLREAIDLTILTRLEYIFKSSSATWNVGTFAIFERFTAFTHNFLGTETTNIGAKFAAVGARIDTVNTNLATINNNIEANATNIGIGNLRINQLATDMDTTDFSLARATIRIANVEAAVDNGLNIHL